MATPDTAPQDFPGFGTTGALGESAPAGAAEKDIAAAERRFGRTRGVAKGAAAGGAGFAAKTLATDAGKAGLAGLLGATGQWTGLLVRALEALVGIALLLLGLQALTGTGLQGNPMKAIR